MTANIDQRIAQLDRKTGFLRWGRPVPFVEKEFHGKRAMDYERVKCRLMFSVKGSHSAMESVFPGRPLPQDNFESLVRLYEKNGGRLASRNHLLGAGGGVLTQNVFKFYDQMYQLDDGRFLFLLDGFRVKIYTAEQINNEDFYLGPSASARKLYALMGFFRPAVIKEAA